jgi:hypothetical protein
MLHHQTRSNLQLVQNLPLLLMSCAHHDQCHCHDFDLDLDQNLRRKGLKRRTIVGTKLPLPTDRAAAATSAAAYAPGCRLPRLLKKEIKDSWSKKLCKALPRTAAGPSTSTITSTAATTITSPCKASTSRARGLGCRCWRSFTRDTKKLQHVLPWQAIPASLLAFRLNSSSFTSSLFPFLELPAFPL